MFIELPVVYVNNLEEVEKKQNIGIEIEPEEDIVKTTFFFSNNIMMRVNPAFNLSRTVIYFGDDEMYTIDADYETVIALLREKLK